jgi:hypothetical protein
VMWESAEMQVPIGAVALIFASSCVIVVFLLLLL